MLCGPISWRYNSARITITVSKKWIHTLALCGMDTQGTEGDCNRAVESMAL